MEHEFGLTFQDIIGVQIYLEKSKTRLLVGKLTQEMKRGKLIFHLEYDEDYLKNRLVIPLGLELPLTQQHYESKTLFSSFQDRIPSRENPAYPDYCRMMGISVDEENPIILLSTIGKRGPSSFVFEPLFKAGFTPADLKPYRQELGLTLREFSQLFDVSFSHLQRIESGKFSGHHILKRMEIYQKFPKTVLYEIIKHSGSLSVEKKKQLIDIIKKKIEQTHPAK